mmetsp:Transcript_66512/g.158682  ORF Transcript_66512/g.158682 Transcript_66512/m.158682 type:complete len:255 (+) Transcript_66512:260-1024(+)
MPGLDGAVEEVNEACLHSILVVHTVAVLAHPESWGAMGVRRDIHVFGDAAPVATNVAKDQREARLLEVETLLKGAHPQLLAHQVPQLLHLVQDTVLQLVDLDDSAQGLEIDGARWRPPSRHLGEGPSPLDLAPEALLSSDGGSMRILAVVAEFWLVFFFAVLSFGKVVRVLLQVFLALHLKLSHICQHGSTLLLEPNFLDPSGELLECLSGLLVTGCLFLFGGLGWLHVDIPLLSALAQLLVIVIVHGCRVLGI